jgi:hypothetical protein
VACLCIVNQFSAVVLSDVVARAREGRKGPCFSVILALIARSFVPVVRADGWPPDAL